MMRCTSARRRPPTRHELRSGNVRGRPNRTLVEAGWAARRVGRIGARFTRLLGARPGITAWVLAYLALAVFIVGPQLQFTVAGDAWGRAPVHADDLRATAVEAIDLVLEEMGHAVEVRLVELRPMEYATAAYFSLERAVRYNPEEWYTRRRVLEVAGHECVHALLHQRGISRSWSGLDGQLIEEVIAEVLGAHLAGRVVDRLGGDGHQLTADLVHGYRGSCALYLRLPLPEEPGLRHSIRTHYGNPEMVDAAHLACLANPDPIRAAQAARAALRRISTGWPPP